MEHPWVAMLPPYGIRLHAVAIKPNSSKDHQTVALVYKSRDFFLVKKPQDLSGD